MNLLPGYFGRGGPTRVRLDLTRPPVFFQLGHRPSQLQNFFTVANCDTPGSISLIKVNAVNSLNLLNLRQVQTHHVVQRPPDVEIRRVDAALWTRLRLQRGQGPVTLHRGPLWDERGGSTALSVPQESLGALRPPK